MKDGVPEPLAQARKDRGEQRTIPEPLMEARRRLGEANPTRTGSSEEPSMAGMAEGRIFAGGPEMEAVSVKPGRYTADGDPYTYQVNEDGSFTIVSGPTGAGARLDSGVAYDAIMGQIKSGILKPSAASDKIVFQPPTSEGSQLGRSSLKESAMAALDKRGVKDA